MQSTIPVAYILLIAAAVALVVFYLAWSRRSGPIQDRRDRRPDQDNRAPPVDDREQS